MDDLERDVPHRYQAINDRGPQRRLAQRFEDMAERMRLTPGPPDAALSPAQLCVRRSLTASGGEVGTARFWAVLADEVRGFLVS